MRDDILTVTGLQAGYGGKPMISDVTFSLGRGEIFCIVGESGCGKSTLLKALLGTTPGLRITSGSIRLEDTELTQLPDAERRELCTEKMGMVFQNPGSSFNPIRSYKKQFIETLKSHGRYDKDAFPHQVEEAFGKLGLNDVKRIINSCPYEMSGGMNQRIAMAIMLILGQDILLADEPTSALDATIQKQMAEELRHLRDVSGISMIIVTHNLALAEYLGDRIAVIYSGHIAELGDASEVLNRPVHPYTKSLIDAIPTLDGRMPTGLPGSPPMTGPEEKGCEFCPRCPAVCDGCDALTYSMRDIGDGHYVSCPYAKGGTA
ncbi:MAG: ABC transporter ATP-binding protein [Oscillospiraceae bacterium]|nr:ABC transporter ATP-binding protein [Oscillospiraceae bacterium]